jgi:hypothetical protein
LTAAAARADGTARAIERAVLDYFAGWFEGDAARMEAASNPELSTRSRRADGDEGSKIARAASIWA